MQDVLKNQDERSLEGAQPVPDNALGVRKRKGLEAVEVISLAVTMLLALAGLAPILLVLLFI